MGTARNSNVRSMRQGVDPHCLVRNMGRNQRDIDRQPLDWVESVVIETLLVVLSVSNFIESEYKIKK